MIFNLIGRPFSRLVCIPRHQPIDKWVKYRFHHRQLRRQAVNYRFLPQTIDTFSGADMQPVAALHQRLKWLQIDSLIHQFRNRASRLNYRLSRLWLLPFPRAHQSINQTASSSFHHIATGDSIASSPPDGSHVASLNVSPRHDTISSIFLSSLVFFLWNQLANECQLIKINVGLEKKLKPTLVHHWLLGTTDSSDPSGRIATA